jgi:NB-ARC domain/Domain of unknown function (DUF4062)
VAIVFISSTGRDLAEYREAAIAVCNRLGLIPDAMEYFEAMGFGATEGSKRKLDRADVYVGILAHRYGYIEMGMELSVTEAEFIYAGDRGLERLCFLVDPRYPWPPDFVDYENYSKVRAFKSRVDRALIRSEFTTVDDFRVKLMHSLVEWQQRNQNETAIVASTPERATQLAMAAPRPRLLIGRDLQVAELKRRLGVFGNEHQDLTIIRGWPGVGKTTLVASIAYDPEVKDAFRDGLLWASVGQVADTRAILATWSATLDVRQDSNASLDRLIRVARSALRDRQMLLIVDDVWQSNDAIPFKQVCGKSCSLLITTRFTRVARELASTPEEIYRLDVLSPDASFELARWIAPTVVRQYPDEIRLLLNHIEHLPLAIRVAGRLLESEAYLGQSVIPLMNELGDSHRLLAEIAPDDRFDPNLGTTPTISLLLKRSTDSLGDAERHRFAMLGAFAPKPATFDLEAVKFVWEVIDPMPSIRQLVDRGLLEPIPADGRFQMHAVMVMHAQSLLES